MIEICSGSTLLFRDTWKMLFFLKQKLKQLARLVDQSYQQVYCKHVKKPVQ